MPRPRQFDDQVVLDHAASVFWRHGYAGTAMSELVDATGLSSSSLYHRFGDKDGIFIAAIDHYATRGVSERIARLNELSDPLESIRQFFDEIVDLSACSGDHPGCLLVNSAVDGGGMSAEARRHVAAHLGEVEAFFHDRLTLAKSQRRLDRAIIPERRAEELMATILAIRVLARLDPDPARLRRLADAALAGIYPPTHPTEKK